MQKIPVDQLLQELQAIDSRVVIVPNENRPGLSNIKVNGIDICPIPQFELQDEHTPDYIYTFPNDMQAPMKTYGEAKEMAERFLQKIKDPVHAAEFFDTDLNDTESTQYGVHKV
jgi:hypothetical protein